jgi:hypothetical protein
MTLPHNGNDAPNSRLDEAHANSIKTGSHSPSEPIAEVDSVEEFDVLAQSNSIKTGS